MLKPKKRPFFYSPLTIAIVGSHYAGKTTLSRLLGKKLSCPIIEETWYRNPFLETQSSDMLSSQLWHLQQAADALNSARELKGDGKTVVLDTLPQSTYIFSKNSLNDLDFSKFEHVYRTLIKTSPMPDVLIYLRATTKFLFEKRRLKRIQENSGPQTDCTVDYSWIKSSCAMHDEIFGAWRICPNIVLDVEKLDFVHRKEDLEELTSNIRVKMKDIK